MHVDRNTHKVITITIKEQFPNIFTIISEFRLRNARHWRHLNYAYRYYSINSIIVVL